MEMTEDGAWIIVTNVWRKIIQKGTPSSFGRLLYGRIKQGYTFDHRFYGKPKSWSYFRIWGTGRGRRVPTSQARRGKNS